MAKTVTLENKLMQATRRIERPVGVTGPTRNVRGEDHTGDAAVWLNFSIDDEKVDLPAFVEFEHRVSDAAWKISLPVIAYLRFIPVGAESI